MTIACRAAIFALTFALLVNAGSSSLAVQPDEVLQDSALEARARLISKDLRCLVCQNQSIDDSDASLAKDLRILVRERLVAGDSNSEVIDYVVSRYGEFVLLKPRISAQNIVLWGAPFLLLLLGGGLLLHSVRKPRSTNAKPSLSSDEKETLSKILGDRDRDNG